MEPALHLQGEKLQQAFNHRACARGVFHIALDFQLASATGDAHAELALDELDILVKAAEQRDGIFHSVDIDNLFRMAQLLIVKSYCNYTTFFGK